MEKLGWKTPFEMVYKRKPAVHYFVSPGSKAYTLDKSIPKNFKTDPRAFIGYHVGYEGINIFRIWIPPQRKVIRTKDVQFNKRNIPMIPQRQIMPYSTPKLLRRQLSSYSHQLT